MQNGLGGSNAEKWPISCGFSELLLPFDCYRIGRCELSKIVEMLFLTAFHSCIMYAKIRAKNWATLFEINTSKEAKIKSVAQFI